jgi:hypothetical protein
MRVPIAGGTDIAAFAPAPLRLLAAGVTNPISARVADTPSTPCGYPAVSVKYSKPRNGKIVRAKSLRCATLHSRDGRKPAAEYGSRLQAPPIRNSLAKHVEHIPTQTDIIRMRLRPLKPGLMPPLQRRHAITNPVVATKHLQLKRRPLNRRPTMHSHSASHTLRTPTRLTQTAFLPQHIQRGTQRRTRMRLDPLHASLAPQLQRLPPLPSRPLIRIERHQLWRRRHRQRRTPMHRQRQDTALSGLNSRSSNAFDGTRLDCFHRPRAARCACRDEPRNPTS